jgi:predicted ribosome quality control (RQC) complex YloA/Tae2 family protein
VRSLVDCIENIENITGEFIRWYFFHTFKESFIDSTAKKIKQDKSLLNGYIKRSSEIKERRSYREIGDLILAHAHSIGTGVANALVMDYYTNQQSLSMSPKFLTHLLKQPDIFFHIDNHKLLL